MPARERLHTRPAASHGTYRHLQYAPAAEAFHAVSTGGSLHVLLIRSNSCALSNFCCDCAVTRHRRPQPLQSMEQEQQIEHRCEVRRCHGSGTLVPPLRGSALNVSGALVAWCGSAQQPCCCLVHGTICF
jgi:hypothetical protein